MLLRNQREWSHALRADLALLSFTLLVSALTS
jgi:hypothetical protein